MTTHPLGAECDHGALARSCPRCEDAATIARLTALVRRLEWAEILTLLREIRDALAPARARLTCEEAGKILRVSRHHLSDLIDAGVVRADVTGRAKWIPRSEVDRMVRDGVPKMPQRTGRPRKVKAGGAYEAIAAKIKERTGT